MTVERKRTTNFSVLWLGLCLQFPHALSSSEVSSRFDYFGFDAGLTREERFPSVEERVKIYMTSWYNPPCHDSDRFHFTLDSSSHTVSTGTLKLPNGTKMELTSAVEADQVIFLQQSAILQCSKGDFGDMSPLLNSLDPLMKRKTELRFKNMIMYCQDVMNSAFVAYRHIRSEENSDRDKNKPLLFQFGDLRHSKGRGHLEIPHFKKFRSALSPDHSKPNETSSTVCGRRTLETMHGANAIEPIVWKLASARHYRQIPRVYREDTPWKDKKRKAIFRGQLTGSQEGFQRKRSDVQNCLNWRRCRIVYENANSELIDAKLTSTRNRMPDHLNGVDLVDRPLPIRDLLEFKAIIMLEGNDVASGLKWALLSQSVVIMPPPRHTSWAMEELLVPWKHYVPLLENATDAHDQVQWVLENDDQARQIAERASLWIQDLCLHPEALEDDQRVQEQMMRRYFAHFH